GALVTGALHLDALADTADALGASTRERALEIMRDHHIGAYGAAALVFDVGIKVAAVAVLATRGDAVRACAAAVAVSRVVPVVLGVALPYARAGAGLGRVLTTAGWGRAVVAAAFGTAVAALLGFAPLLVVA